MDTATLTERIEAELGDKACSEVKELIIKSCKSKNIEGLTKDYTSLETLDLSGIGLENISGLPKLPSLRKLNLSNNNIPAGVDIFTNCPNVQELDLSSNKFASFDCLLPLSQLTALQTLKLSDCEVTNKKGYRQAILSLIPHLKFLDGQENEFGDDDDAENGEVGDDDEEGDEDISDDDDDEEEEYGLETLQRSGELEDDDEEDDYAPGKEAEAELDEYEDLDDEEDIEDNGANLSGADVSGPRRPGSKRRRDNVEVGKGDGNNSGTPKTKQRAVESEADKHVKNGTAVDK